MARITVEDCLEKIDSQYELVLLAKERTAQLNAGDRVLVPEDNDKNTVICTKRDCGRRTIKVPNLEESAIYKLRKHVEQIDDGSDDDEEVGDDFESMYKGEISKSGTPILPSKRARKTPEKIQVTKEDLEELTPEPEPEVEVNPELEVTVDNSEVSSDQKSEAEESVGNRS